MENQFIEMRSQAMGKLKQDLVEEMGFWEIVQTQGWGALAAKDCGRIGGRMASQLSPNMLRKLATMGNTDSMDMESETNPD
jgi:hypothetical protein